MAEESIFELADNLEQSRAKIMMSADMEKLTEVISDELYYGHSGGYWDTKESLLQKISEGQYVYHLVAIKVEKAVSIGNDGLVVHGQVTLHVRLHGSEKEMDSIYLAVWQKESGSWRFLAHQTVLLPKENS